MTCYHPINAYKSRQKIDGKYSVVFKDCGPAYTPIKLPCNQCIGCRIERSRQWALRCVHEASLYTYNCFITLTYDDSHLDTNGSLNVSDFQLFMKRLRKQFQGLDPVIRDGVTSHPIRFFHCGEYGSQLGRPHHHACIFNFDFPDKELWSVRDGVRLYRSKALEELWPFGFSTIGDVTYESAAYVARYIMKKINGKRALLHYGNVDESTGELSVRMPEYITMSRRPGIAFDWFAKFKNDVFPKDFITCKGKKLRPPKYYDRIYDLEHPEQMEAIRKNRVDLMRDNADNITVERLAVREQSTKLKVNKLIRSYEDG